MICSSVSIYLFLFFPLCLPPLLSSCISFFPCSLVFSFYLPPHFIVSCFFHLFFYVCFVFGATAPQWARASSFTRSLDHTQQRTTVGRTPLDEWSARRRDLYLTTHTTLITDKRPCPRWDWAGERPQTAWDRAATGTGLLFVLLE